MKLRDQRAFTLLEVLVVLVIGALAYAVVLAVPMRTSGAELKSGARAIAAALRQAQATAMSTRRDTLVTIDLDERAFLVTGEPNARPLPKAIDLKLYTAQQEVTSERRGSIRFYPDGSSTGGRVTVAMGERKYLVDVDWLTGRVSIRD
jgi:general secretion pathway protein H